VVVDLTKKFSSFVTSDLGIEVIMGYGKREITLVV
jgi:hypothetical protein